MATCTAAITVNAVNGFFVDATNGNDGTGSQTPHPHQLSAPLPGSVSLGPEPWLVLSKFRILVLEDDLTMLQVVQQVLEEEGYSVDACSSGDKAIELARQESYDLVVADIRMDGLDGLAALAEVQAYQPDVGSLVITGYADQAETERATRLGLNGLLKKPFELDIFLDTVSRILSERHHQLAQRKKTLEDLEQARWATTWTAELLSSGSDYPFDTLARLTRQLSLKMGLGGHRAEKLSLAALWKAGEAHNCPSSASPPKATTDYLSVLQERWDGSGPQGLLGRSIPVEARILSLALEAQRKGELPSLQETGFDPLALQALQSLNLDPHPEEDETETPREQGLLNIARALLEGGDYVGAQSALQELVNQEAASPSGVEASLELAKLKGILGRREEAVSLASRVPENASHFGPLLTATTSYRCALLLKEFGSETRALGLLQEAASIYLDLGLEVQASLCGLAQKWVQNETLVAHDIARLETLLAPQNRASLLSSLSWLVPCLLSSQIPQVAQPLSSLATSFPQALSSSLARSSPAERDFALQLFQNMSSPVATGIAASLSRETSPQADKGEAVPSPTDSQEACLTLRSLGRFEFYYGDTVLPDSAWKTRKVKYLLARLASAEGTVSEDSLLEDFWPGDLRRAKKNLQATTSYLRKGLRQLGVAGDLIQKLPGGLLLQSTLPLWHDLTELRKAYKAARESLGADRESEALGHYRQLFQIYEGAFLEECYMEWAIQIRNEVEDKVLEASLKLADTALEKSRFDEALECARRASTLDPCLAEATSLVMRAYLGQKRPSAAVRHFEKHKSVLALEFDAPPSIEVERLHLQARLQL